MPTRGSGLEFAPAGLGVADAMPSEGPGSVADTDADAAGLLCRTSSDGWNC
jgi:hypothetical protein